MVIPFAEQLLAKHGTFHPIGGAIAPDGELIPVAVYDGREDAPAEDVIAHLKEALLKGADDGRYIATALAYDSTINLPTGGESNAVTVLLDHRDNFSVIVYFPYQMADRAVSFDPSFHQDGESEIFQ
jgi:hypothetical protein